MSKFPATIKTDTNMKALHNAMPSVLEETIVVDEPFAFSGVTLPGDVVVIFERKRLNFDARLKRMRCYCSAAAAKF